MFNNLSEKFDGIIVLDADCTIAPQALHQFNQHFNCQSFNQNLEIAAENIARVATLR